MAGPGAAYIFGEKLKVPKYPTVDFLQLQHDYLAQNQQLLPQALDYASRINQLTSQEFNAQMERQLPGYAKLRDTLTGNYQAGAQGLLPPGVEQQTLRDIAEINLGRGTAGSTFSVADAARSLGLNRLAYAQYSMDSASRWLAQSRAATPYYDFTKAFIPLEQRLQTKLQENAATYQRNLLAAKIHSIPWGWKGFTIDAINAIQQDAHTFGQMMAGYGVGSIGAGGMGGGAGAGEAASAENVYGLTGYGSAEQGGGMANYAQYAQYGSAASKYGGRVAPGNWAPSGSETPNYMSLYQ